MMRGPRQLAVAVLALCAACAPGVVGGEAEQPSPVDEPVDSPDAATADSGGELPDSGDPGDAGSFDPDAGQPVDAGVDAGSDAGATPPPVCDCWLTNGDYSGQVALAHAP